MSWQQRCHLPCVNENVAVVMCLFNTVRTNVFTCYQKVFTTVSAGKHEGIEETGKFWRKSCSSNVQLRIIPDFMFD